LKEHPEVYAKIDALSARLCAAGLPGVTVNRVGSMFTFFFTPDPVADAATARKADTKQFARFFHWMLDRGVYLAPSQFEAAFMGAAHTEADIDYTIEQARGFFADGAQ
jgi:glutamate-1-semialdehyde 2,1-aminomutase